MMTVSVYLHLFIATVMKLIFYNTTLQDLAFGRKAFWEMFCLLIPPLCQSMKEISESISLPELFNAK